MPVYILVSSKWSQYKNQPYFDLHHGGMAGNEFSVRNTPDLRSYGCQLLFYETHRSSTKTCCMILSLHQFRSQTTNFRTNIVWERGRHDLN